MAKDTEKSKLEKRKEEIQARNKELDDQFVKVQNWITSARNEYTANLGRIDEIDKLIKGEKEDKSK